MTPDTVLIIETWIWTTLYLGSCALFFGIAVWVIIRGGKDIRNILSEALKQTRDV